MFFRKLFITLTLLASLVGTTIQAQAAPQSVKSSLVGPVEVSSAVHSDVSAPLRTLSGAAPTTSSSKEKKEKPLRIVPNMGNALKQADGALQTSAGPQVSTTNGLSFDGIGNSTFRTFITGTPPDTNGAVGATQYVQTVNGGIGVYDKSTGLIAAGFPKLTNALWAGFGGGCQTNNDGDPIVAYDKLNQRWIVTQFSVSTTPYLECVAVSTTSDATGTYNRYAFTYGNTQFNDYPKLGVWPDGYYISYNIFNNGSTWAGPKVCALDATAMRAAQPATQQCFQMSTSVGSMLPSDMDGTTPPPAGSPNYFLSYGFNSLNMWKFHVDFANSANTTLTGPTLIPVPAFSAACNGGGTCIPELGGHLLDSLADRLMYRLAYRNFGDHESLVVNHSVTAGTSVGLRWYELRSPNATPVLYQSGTYAPDANYRWMGSIAMDKAGDIALGYSVSSSTMYPAIRYTGRLASDAPGTLQAENTIVNGTGASLSYSRWGDYSDMTVDPVNDCTFWYTTEYYSTTGDFNWNTRIASFSFPNCTNPPVLTSITVSPASASVVTGGTQQFSATGLDQNGQPMSPQPAFSWNVSGGGTIDPTGLFSAGAAAGGPFTVTATSGAVSGTASVTVILAPPVLTTISVSPASASVVTGATQQFSATGLDQYGQPVSPQPVFSWSVSGGGTIDPTGLFTAGAAAGGPFTVTATSGSVNGTASVTVTAPPPVLTTISVSPASASVVTGGTQQFSATGLDQYGQPVSPQPSFGWSVSGGGTIDTTGLFTAGAAAGGPFTVTATSGSVNGTASVSVTAAPPVLTTISVSPLSASVVTGGTQQFSATGLDQYGQPVSPQPTFGWSVSGGGTINTAGLFTAGAAAGGPFTVTASSGSVNGTASVSVTSAPPTADFSISVSPASQSIKRGLTATYTVTITALNGFNGSVTLSLAGQPAGSTISFTPNPASSSSTLKVVTLKGTSIGIYSLTINGVSGSLSHTAAATLTVTRK